LTERVLSLAGEPANAPVAGKPGVLALPVEKTLVDEELAHWLEAAKNAPLAVVVSGRNGVVEE
jgi:hypothetical protein